MGTCDQRHGFAPDARQRLADAAGPYRGRLSADLRDRGRGLVRGLVAADPPFAFRPSRSGARRLRPRTLARGWRQSGRRCTRPAGRPGRAGAARPRLRLSLRQSRLADAPARRPARLDRLVQRAAAADLSANLPHGGRRPRAAARTRCRSRSTPAIFGGFRSRPSASASRAPCCVGSAP